MKGNVVRATKWVAVLALASGLALSGCSSNTVGQAGLAARVGDRDISVDTLQRQAKAVQKIAPTQTDSDTKMAGVQASLLQSAIYAELFQGLAEKNGVTGVDGEIDKAVAAQMTQSKGSGLPEDLVRDQIAAQTYYTKLSSKFSPTQPSSEAEMNALLKKFNDGLADVAADEGVTVNPRFGKWDAEAPVLALGQQGVSLGTSVVPEGGDLVKTEVPVTGPVTLPSGTTPNGRPQ